MARAEIIRALLDEMKARLLSATPETRHETDAAIVLYSNVLATFAAQPSLPAPDCFT